jgi:hypothetical protein
MARRSIFGASSCFLNKNLLFCIAELKIRYTINKSFIGLLKG